jgi:hypothetical protein
VPSVPSRPKRARAAEVVNSLVFEARIRACREFQRKTARPAVAL